MDRVHKGFWGMIGALTLLVMFIPLLASAQPINFAPSDLQGAGISRPTSLQFGPDDRLYVSEQSGGIKAFTVQRNGAEDYQVIATETINLVKNNVQNHNDDGTLNGSESRQITGLLVIGTALNPVLIVSSSDSRIGGASGGTDKGLDTNSGVISRLTCTGGIGSGSCQGWEHIDLVRGLPRSEENHATNGMDLDEVNNILYVMSGGHANKGAPSNNFAGTPEYYLSGAMLSVDLDMIDAMPVQTDTSTTPATQYVYDLPTLDDPQRANIDGISDKSDPAYTGIDIGDPFGGNNGLNQAIPEPGGPVQIHSPGYRNAFDVVFTESGDLYTWDNGPNGGWGGQPLIYDSIGNQKGTQNEGAVYNPAAGDYCTNDFNESGDQGHGDQLHLISGSNYYGGHPAPIRAFPDLAGIMVFEKDGGTWPQVGSTYTFSDLLPAGLSIADFPDDPQQCDYLTNDPNKYLEKASSSTNGIAEYLGSNFSAAMQGDILAASFSGNVYRCKPDGSGGLVDLPGSGSGLTNNDCEVLFGGFGTQPLDVTTLGDDAPFPGTVWAATIGSQKITVFEPDDFFECNPTDPAEDSDGDGFTNGDEVFAGSDPCSAASRPDDFDGDGISNASDPDDDNDGIPDVDDPFALDPLNGLGTSVPLDYPFFNTDPGTGLFGLGFTGLMLPADGTTTWEDLFDPGQLAAGGTSGLMTVENVSAGDAFGTGNNQDNGFLFGADIDSNTLPVIISTRLQTPFFGGLTPQPWQAYGFFIGTGDQDNYLKVVLNHNGGDGGVEVLLEDGAGSTSSTQYVNTDWNSQDILSAGQVDLQLLLDPQAGTAQPQVSLDQGTTVFDLGAPITLPTGWLDPGDAQGLAIGIISTSNGPGAGAPAFNATWDFLKVDFVPNAAGTPLFRVNAGGPEIAPLDGGPDWTADTDTANSEYLANAGSNNISGHATNSFDPGVPASTPGDVYLTERWEGDGGDEMLWTFPTGNGAFRVRLYMKNGWDGTSNPGQRIFDVAVEGSVPAIYDDLDLSDQFGHRVAVMLPHEVVVSDGTLDIEFLHGAANNPNVNAIEILSLDSSGSNQPPAVDPIADQNSQEGDVSTVSVTATDSDGPENLEYSATGLPPGLDIEFTNGQIFGTIADGAASGSPYAVTITVDDGADSSQISFTWNVTAATGGGGETVLFRVNNGGELIAAVDGGPDWTADTDTANSAYLANAGSNNVSGWPTNSFDTSVPSSTPQDVFLTERWDDSTDAAGEMLWSFPTGNGDFRVRLHMKNGYEGTSDPGQRIFDVAVEGSVPVIYDDLDLSDQFGHRVAGMLAHDVTVSDGSLDIEFLHSPANNPTVNAIEVIALGAGGGNTPPVANAGADQSVDEGDLVTLDGSASSDADTDPLGYSWTQLSGPGVTLSDANDPMPSFTASQVSSQQTLVFELTVDDGTESDSDTVTVTVNDVSTGGGTLADAEFQQIALSNVSSNFYTTVTVGPDGKLYALDIAGNIHRWSINPDGTLANDEQVITTITDAETDNRLSIGLAFDPTATAGNLIAWATHVDGGQGGGDKFSGKITRLSGPDLGTGQDFVSGLPRSTGDHAVNSLAFGPAGDLYVNVGSMSAMGALDGSWNDTETLLSAATLRVDLDAITSPPLDVQTEAGGSYDPFASGAQVTIFGQGVRNAYDLVWHSNGFLYVPTNGSAPGNTPASDAADICPDGLNYSGPPVPALNSVSEQPDFLFKVEQGGYYGHPNPTLCNYVLNGGNPTAGSDLNEVSQYPVGTTTDADYVAADSVLDFAVFGSANSHSPNGVVEYQSASFDGGLQGSLLVARFHKSDIVAIRPNTSDGAIAETASGITGMSGLSNPLDLAENPANGNLYVSESGSQTITLLRPLGDGLPNIDADRDELIYSGVQGTPGEIQSLVVTNNGSADLDLTSVALAGSNATDFAISADPAPVTLQPGLQATVSVQFTPGSGVTGALSALLQINSDDPDEPVLEIGLFGLSAQALEGSNEPPLQQVVDTLGYAIDVGGTALSLGTGPAPIGDEVETSLFRKPSGDSPVTIEPVARYSPAFQLPFGWYEPDGTSSPTLNQVGELSGASSPAEHQTLFPELASGTTSFDPGGKTFGLYTTSDTHTAHTEDELNPDGFEPHSVRVYPLKDRNGNAVPNSFLVAFEEASNGDYQDYVFVIRNVLPAQPAGSGCAPISPQDCPQVPVNLPYNLNWDADEGGVGDASDVGTGFTMIDPPSNGDGYLPANLAVNTAASTLDISTTDGIQFGPTGTNPNSLDNGLGVGFDADLQTSLMETTLADLPAAPGGFAQAGLWLFLDESHYVKLVALARDTGGWEIQLNYEKDNETAVPELESGADVAAGGDDVSLALDIDPVTNQVTGLYSINGGTEQMLGPINVDPTLLAGKLLPDGSGPLSFGGIFATQRNAAQQVFSFDDFALSLTGTAANLPPLVSNPGNQTGLEGDAVSLQISANDPDGDDAALTYAAIGLPDGLSIDTSTGLISGTIAADASLGSPIAVTITVSDAEDTTDVSFDWNVGVPGDINSGLLLHWPFDETGGLVASDISGNNNDGAVSASGATFVAGQLGNAIQLDGVAGFVADDDAESFLNGLEQITVTTWVKADSTPTDEGIFTTANPDNKDEFLAMRYDAVGFAGGETAVIKAAVGNGEPSGNFSVLETSSNVQTTDWQHLALVWELGAPAQIYIDGVLNSPSDVTGTMAAALNAVDRLWVGRASKFDNGEFGWQGLIDDFRIYGRVLAGSEIQQLAAGDIGGGNNPPGVTNPGDQTSIEGDVISLQIDAADADAGDTLSYSASNLPDGLSIDPASGLISGTIASSAVAGSPFTVEITVTDGIDPVTVQFQWTVSEPADPMAAADVSITPNGGLTATTFNGDAFVITNTGDYPITSVSIDLSTALFADNVFDPIGAAGDAGAKCLTPNSGAAATGFMAPADPCVDPFANPHDGGFEILTINFDDFGPGESFGFNTDVDPTSIKNATGTGDAGAVSGLELTGSMVTVNFDDGAGGVNLVGETFQIAPNSQGGSVAQLREVAPTGATLSVSGLALLDIDLASPDGASGPFSHAAASLPNADAAQTIIVDTGSAGDNVRLLQVEAALLALNGFELEPFEANEAIEVSSQTAITGAGGTVSIPVTLTRSNPTVGGYNYFAAVVDGPDGSSVVSNYIILRLESPAGGNQPPVANDDLVGISAGEQDVMIDLLANDSDVDGVLDASSIVIVDAPTQGSLTPGVLGVYEYDHTGGTSDSFTYTVDDNEAATSNLATVFIQVQPPVLPDDVDGDGDDNVADNDDDNDGLLDTEDPFAIDADNGTGTDLPVRLPLFSDDPGTGLFGLGFTGLMSNGEIGGAQGDDYLDLFDPARIFINDNPSGTGTLTILNIPEGDAFQGDNNQQDAFQLGLNVDTDSQPFVVHTRMLAPFFNDLTPQNFQSQGLFIGTGEQENYLKMVIDGNDNDIELLLEVGGLRVAAQSGNFGGANDFIAADTVDLYLVVDPTSFDAVANTVLVDARVALDEGVIQTIATTEIPGDWLTPGDGFGLAAGLISTSNGVGPEFDATWDEFAAFHLAADDQFDVLEDSGLNVLDVLANDFDETGLNITAVGATDNGGTAVANGNSIDYTPAADFAGIETFTYSVENADGIVATAVVAVNVLPVNDPPSITLAGDQQVLEDAGSQTVADFATGFAPGGGADEAGQAVAGFVVSNDNNALFSTPPAIDGNGELTYESAPDANGSANVTVQVMDDGGMANGGDDLSAAQTFVVTVDLVNDAPSIALLGDQTVAEDAGAQSVSGFAFDFNPGGGADETGQSIGGFVVSNNNNALFAAQPDIATDGTLSYTPTADANGVAMVTVSVLDDGGVANGGVDQSVEQSFLITVTPQNDAPVITAPADATIDEDQVAGPLSFSIADTDTDPGSILVTFASDNPALLPNGNIVLSGTISDRMVTLTPLANQFGSAVITITADDGDGGISQSQFTLTVNAVNDDPVITAPADVAIDEDTGTGALAFTVSDGETDATSLLVSSTSSDQMLLPDGNIVLAGAGANRTVMLTPAADANGSAVVTLTVTDADTATAQAQFTLTVNAVNDDPVITAPADVAIDEDTATGALAFTVSDVETDAASLLVTASSSDQTLLPDGNIVLAGAGANRTVMLTPAADANGSAVVTLTVTDADTATAQAQFTLTVNAVNDDPVITAPADVATDKDTATAALAFTVSDGETDAASLLVTASSSDQTLLPDGNIVLAGAGANRTVMLTPAADANGSAVVTLTVTDADTATAQAQFTLTVNAVNDDPVITAPADVATDEDTATAALAFTVSDGETDATSLLVSATSSDQMLLPDGNIVLAGAGANRTVMLTPAADANGSAVVTLTVTDADTATAQAQFTLTVNAVNDDPVITAPADVAIDEDTATGALAFTVSDVETDAASLLVTASSSDQTLLPDGNIVLAGAGANRTVMLTPAADANGSAVVTLTVTDADSGTAQSQFTLTVDAVNDAPAIVIGADQSVLENAPAQLVTDFATGFAPGGGVDEAGQAIAEFVVSNDNNALFTAQPAIALDGSLSYTLAADTTGSATVSVQVRDDGGVANGGDDLSAVQTFTISVDAQAELSISKVADTATVVAGETLTWTITVSNAGPSLASNVVVTDVLPAGVANAVTSGCGNDPAALPDCQLGDIAAGDQAQFSISADVEPETLGDLANTATVVSETPEADSDNNAASVTVSVDSSADLSISKQLDSDPVIAGTVVTYTVTVSNAGPSTAVAVVASDVLDAKLVENASASGCNNDPDGLPACQLGDLAPGDDASFTITADLLSSATGTLDNTATVTSSTDDPDAANNAASISAAIDTVSDLVITQVDSIDPVPAGAALSYNVTVVNNGPSDAINVTTGGLLPLQVVDAQVSACIANPADPNGCSLGTITAGEVITYEQDMTVLSDANGATLANEVSVNSDTTDDDAGNNMATEDTAVIAVADLAIDKVSGTVFTNPEASIEYTISVTNPGPSDVLAARVTDMPPARLGNLAWMCDGFDGGICSNAAGMGDIDELVDLPAGSSVEFILMADLQDDLEQPVTNTASVAAPGDASDPSTGNNQASDTDAVGMFADGFEDLDGQ